MNSNSNIRYKSNHYLHFKQWSNKGYAAFCSMGKVVLIGNLAISLTQWIGDLIEHVNQILFIRTEKEEDDDELREEELLQVIPVMIGTQNEYGNSVISIRKNINCR